ncbi:MAG: hypothetical protein ACR2PP_02470 [Psychrobacter sp.]
MAIEDDPARANQAYFEAARGIETVLEMQIHRLRTEYDQNQSLLAEAGDKRRMLQQEDIKHKEGFVGNIATLTENINATYMMLDEILPISSFNSSMIDTGADFDPETALKEASKDALDALSYADTTSFNAKRIALNRMLELRRELEEEDELHQQMMPDHIAEVSQKEMDLFIKGAQIKRDLETKVGMRSAEMRQAIATYYKDPEMFVKQDEAFAYRQAQEKMAIAYEKGANDEQAYDVWEGELVEHLYHDDPPPDSAAVDFAFYQDEQHEKTIAERDALQEANKRKDAELEAMQQKLDVFREASRKKANQSPTEVVEERHQWKMLEFHPADKNHLKYAKRFLNKMKPLGKTIEVLLDDQNYKGEFDNHARRALALRGGKLVDGRRFSVFVNAHVMMNRFECVFEDGNECQLALQESVVTEGKYALGTAFYIDTKRWTSAFEQNEALHGVPADAAQNKDNTPEQLSEWHPVLKSYLVQ